MAAPQDGHTLRSRLVVSHLLVALVAVAVVAMADWVLTSVAAERFVEQIAHIEERTGFVPPGRAGRSLPATEQFRAQITAAALAGAAVAGVVGVGLALLAGARLSRPLRDASRAASRVAAGQRQLVMPSVGVRELDELSAALERLAADLDATERERDRIVDDVAHELRTPLTVLRGNVEGMRDGVIVAEPASFDRLLAELRRLERLVEDLRATGELSPRDLTLRALPVSSLLTSAADRHRMTADAVGVRLEMDLPPPSLAVEADEGRLAQVLDNLIANALAHAPRGSSVKLGARRAGAVARIEVADQGPGLAPRQQALVFERLYRTDDARDRARGGAGIGLALAKRIVEAHGGRIGVESGEGQGATFWFELSLAE